MHQCISFFYNDTATPELYTLSLHDALPIYRPRRRHRPHQRPRPVANSPPSPSTARHTARRPSSTSGTPPTEPVDRKSTRLNSSHVEISYAVFCLKKKKEKK